MLAAVISTGDLFSAKLRQSTNSEAFAGFLGLLNHHVGKPLTVILDNASIHKSRPLQPTEKFRAAQKLTLYFLALYRPELNRIEKLWHKMKYPWMAAKLPRLNDFGCIPWLATSRTFRAFRD